MSSPPFVQELHSVSRGKVSLPSRCLINDNGLTPIAYFKIFKTIRDGLTQISIRYLCIWIFRSFFQYQLLLRSIDCQKENSIRQFLLSGIQQTISNKSFSFKLSCLSIYFCFLFLNTKKKIFFLPMLWDVILMASKRQTCKR